MQLLIGEWRHSTEVF